MKKSLHDLIEIIESGYEFLLAYAAQGRDSDRTPSGASEVRNTLNAMLDATIGIDSELAAADFDFARTVRDDAAKSKAALSLVLLRDEISSELVDNLNASIHLRALLTDLFLIGEADI